MCENEESGELFKTYNDVGKHTEYRGGSEDGDPYINNAREGEIDRIGQDIAQEYQE